MWYTLVALSVCIAIYANIVNGYVTCNFESASNPLCGFYQDNSDNFDWQLDTAKTNRSFTRPIADHTYSNKSGHYVFIESTFQAQGSGNVSRFMSPTVIGHRSGSGSVICVKFYYHMYGPPSQNLHVFVRQNGHTVPQFSHWNKSGDLGDVWNKQTLNVSVSGGFQVIFEGTKGIDFYGDISLDDISITEGACEQEASTPTPTRADVPSTSPLSQFECPFEYSNLCGFTNNLRNAFDWQWRGDSEQPPMGPFGDHTRGSTSGFYLFVTKDPSNQQQEQRSRVVSPLFSRNTVHKCLQFYYFMTGNNVGQFNAYVMQENLTLPLLPIWSGNSSRLNAWQPDSLDIPPQPSNYKVVFEVVRGKEYNGNIAIDDITLSNDLCPSVTTSSDFESGLGDFIQDENDAMDWVMWSGGTWSYFSGPSEDHTFSNSTGHYLYLGSGSWRDVERDYAARLISPVLLATTKHPRCLTFWYHMYGSGVESLNVYIINGTSSDKHDVMWTRSGNRGNRWRAAEVHLHSAVNFQIVFEAQQGRMYAGDIALDDINIQADVCPGEHHFHNYSSITCNFEEPELCYYEQDQTDEDDWVWSNGDSGFLRSSGPLTDHTTLTELGFYMHVSYDTVSTHPLFAKAENTARLLSPLASSQKSTSCLEFWYYMYGRDVESLRVYIQKENENIPDTPVWKISGDHGNFWHRATIDINVINIRFRVVFEATTGKYYRDDIAFDDITFYNSSSCREYITQPPPPVILPATRINANCNFEDLYICNYTQRIEDEYDWIRRQGSRFASYWWHRGRLSGPAADHTLMTEKGYYMNFDCGDWWDLPNYRAQLATPYLATHSKPRCIHFYYFMYGPGVDFLHLYVVPFGYTLAIDPQKSLYSNQGDEWHHGTLDLPPSTDPYRVIFEATTRASYLCDISIDDISFTDGACPGVQPTSAPLSAGSCDFEPTDDHLCGYKQDTKRTYNYWYYLLPTDDFDWYLNTGKTPTANTGPTTDHTQGTDKGHYLYIESSVPRRPTYIARLLSPVIEGSTERICVQFYYHMRGNGIGNLRLIWTAENVDETEVLTLSGEQGNDWQAASVELEPYSRQFQLVFEGSIGNVPNGDIAIDDITILRQPCQGNLKESVCSFDVAGDWCGYIQCDQDDLDWEWYDVRHARGEPPINQTGDRSYIYFASPVAVQPPYLERIAKLMSHTIDGRSSQHCVEFDYSMSQNISSSKVNLTVAVIRNDGDQYNVMTMIAKQETQSWQHTRKTLNKEDVGENFQVVFIGTLDDNSGDVIGLDNPTVRLGPCEEKTTSNTRAVATSFGILSAVLLIALLLIAGVYLYRKNKHVFPLLAAKYNANGDTEGVMSVTKDLSMDNPVYVSDSATTQSNVINQSGASGVA